MECLENHGGYREPLQVLDDMLKAPFNKYQHGRSMQSVSVEAEKRVRCSYFNCEVMKVLKTIVKVKNLKKRHIKSLPISNHKVQVQISYRVKKDMIKTHCCLWPSTVTLAFLRNISPNNLDLNLYTYPSTQLSKLLPLSVVYNSYKISII